MDVFYISKEDAQERYDAHRLVWEGEGWYWWNNPDSKPHGPFSTRKLAVNDMFAEMFKPWTCRHGS